MDRLKKTVEISKRFFCFYALLNIAGYKPERLKINPVRTKTLSFLNKNISPDDIEKIKKVINKKGVEKETWFPYRTYILCHGDPPKFTEKSSFWKEKIDNHSAKEFEREIKIFWKKYKINNLWLSVKKYYKNVDKKCALNTTKAINISLKYLKIAENKLSFKEFIVIPNFLEEYNRAVGPKIDKTAYAILGPSEKGFAFPLQRIQHEFLHSIINPLIAEIYKDKIDSKKLSQLREGFVHGIVLKTNKENMKYYANKLKKLQGMNYNIDKIILFLKKLEQSNKDFKGFLEENQKSVL